MKNTPTQKCTKASFWATEAAQLRLASYPPNAPTHGPTSIQCSSPSTSQRFVLQPHSNSRYEPGQKHDSPRLCRPIILDVSTRRQRRCSIVERARSRNSPFGSRSPRSHFASVLGSIPSSQAKFFCVSPRGAIKSGVMWRLCIQRPVATRATVLP